MAEAGRRGSPSSHRPRAPPDGHPLWSAPGVLVTPHVAGGTTAMLPRMAALSVTSCPVRRRRPLRNLV